MRRNGRRSTARGRSPKFLALRHAVVAIVAATLAEEATVAVGAMILGAGSLSGCIPIIRLASAATGALALFSFRHLRTDVGRLKKADHQRVARFCWSHAVHCQNSNFLGVPRDSRRVVTL